MTQLSEWSKDQLTERLDELKEQYKNAVQQNLNLNMARGKPCPEQVELSMGMLDVLDSSSSMVSENGVDLRNYGQLDGIPEAKRFFANLLDVGEEEVIVGGNSSLTLMHDAVTRAMFDGVKGSEKPWSNYDKIKFLAPSPGYDRHFAICERYNIEMIIIDMKEDGPDMDQVEELVKQDETIKGIWCVPKYSNPNGTTYSDEVVDRLASMETKATDFRIFWDDAYTIHHLGTEPLSLKNILKSAKAAGNEDRPYIFASTSKVTFPGAGIATLAASEGNLDDVRSKMAAQTIGYDKMNQIRHVRFFTEVTSLEGHMKKHARIIKPKFDLVYETFREQLGDKGIATWSEPEGGYFISLDTAKGTAKKIVQMAKDAGVTLTGAGATFPYGKDPNDQNIRIAPTYPSMEELAKALQVLCVCIELVTIEKKML
ncbi:aminotransferase class I/II-fold pyridoxal phosphate-dependent enzyme [Geomicrobium sp. JCM 19039]|uniref:aminotransferase class I/II-fold pyridoxal phosphate-dependent enzyme n=1 Tax=Geomicrobium sp. JCM 19039 TaxID=1460636 RepID=UPI00045F2D28|nr:aminotransferase class I/II-fold pyridoxal phosphate-dependent enzyme [Geomicrobium sp. JCM 19039]GAK11743.1 aspartate transaminase [Geomicrobium sp. JCM 19039]